MGSRIVNRLNNLVRSRHLKIGHREELELISAEVRHALTKRSRGKQHKRRVSCWARITFQFEIANVRWVSKNKFSILDRVVSRTKVKIGWRADIRSIRMTFLLFVSDGKQIENVVRHCFVQNLFVTIYLQGHSIRVQQERCSSTNLIKEIQICGVPQGATLGTLLIECK